MCGILILPPGHMINWDKFQNFVWNNPDGYGIVLKDEKNKKIQVIRKCENNQENNPQEIWDILIKNKDIKRYLHVRNRTEGIINLDNTHPFTSYHSDKRTVLFMHNGTLQEYAPKKTYMNGVMTQEASEDSDTKRFNEQILLPFLLEIKGNIESPIFRTLLNKIWPSGINRGLLISSDQEDVVINPAQWERIDSSVEGEKVFASNNNYFDRLIRGPEFDRREKKRREEDEKKKPRFQNNLLENHSSSWPITPLRLVDLKKHSWLKDGVSNLISDPNLWDWDGLAKLAALTDDEIQEFIRKSPEDACYLLLHLSEEFRNLHEKYVKASKHLEHLNNKKREVKVG